MPALAAIGCLLIFGLAVAFIISAGKVLVGQMGWSPLILLGVQNTVAGVLVFAAAAARGIPCRNVLKHLRFFTIAAIGGIALPQAIAFLVAPHLGAAVTSITYLFPPLLTFAFAVMLSMERLDVSGIFSLCCGIAGGILLFWGQAMGPGATLGWLGVALLAPVGQAAGNIYRSKFWPPDVAILPFAATILLLTGLMGFGLGFGLGARFGPAPQDDWGLGLIGACSLAASLGYAVFFYLQRRAGPVYISQGGFVIAGLGALAGTLVFGEALSPYALLGAAIVAVGIAAFTRRLNAK